MVKARNRQGEEMKKQTQEKKCPCKEFKFEWTMKDEKAFQLGEKSGIKWCRQLQKEEDDKKLKEELDKFYSSDKSIICQFCSKKEQGRLERLKEIKLLMNKVIPEDKCLADIKGDILWCKIMKEIAKLEKR